MEMGGEEGLPNTSVLPKNPPPVETWAPDTDALDSLEVGAEEELPNGSIFPGTERTGSTLNTTNTITSPITGCDEMWNLIFGQQSTLDPNYLFTIPSPTIDNSLISVFQPSSTSLNLSNIDMTYVHHYLNVVLPLQYRFVVESMADLVGPLAMQSEGVLKSVSSLAALHLAAQRANRLPMSSDAASINPFFGNDENNDGVVAVATHRQSIERVRFASIEELTSEDVVLPALFALSYHLFLGGTSRDWVDTLAMSRRCLSAALTASPEVINRL